MDRAVAWYSRIFGLAPRTTSHEGKIYDLPMLGDVGLILDAHKPVTNSAQPICFFWTHSIWEVYAFLQDNDVEIVSVVEDIGSVTTLTFKDPDKNLLMVCQRNL